MFARRGSGRAVQRNRRDRVGLRALAGRNAARLWSARGESISMTECCCEGFARKQDMSYIAHRTRRWLALAAWAAGMLLFLLLGLWSLNSSRQDVENRLSSEAAAWPRNWPPCFRCLPGNWTSSRPGPL